MLRAPDLQLDLSEPLYYELIVTVDPPKLLHVPLATITRVSHLLTPDHTCSQRCAACIEALSAHQQFNI